MNQSRAAALFYEIHTILGQPLKALCAGPLLTSRLFGDLPPRAPLSVQAAAPPGHMRPTESLVPVPLRSLARTRRAGRQRSNSARARSWGA